MSLPNFILGGNLTGHVPRYLGDFLSSYEFGYGSDVLLELLKNVRQNVAIAPAAPHMDEYVAAVTNTYYQTKAFCDHVAPKIYFGYRPQIEGYGLDYKSISALWPTTFSELKGKMPEFVKNVENLQKIWNTHATGEDPRRAAEYSKACFYWGASLKIAQEFLRACEINSEKLNKLRPQEAEKGDEARNR